MKKNLKCLKVILGLSLFCLFLSLFTSKGQLGLQLVSACLLLFCFLPVKALIDWEKQFQILETGQLVTPDSFFPESQADLKAVFLSYQKIQNQLQAYKDENTRLSGNLEALTSHLTMGMLLVTKEKAIVLHSNSLPHFFPDTKVSFERIEDIARTDIKATIAEAFDTKQTIKKELSGFHDGDLILEVTAVPIANQEGDIVQVLVLLYDLTTIRSYEKLNMDFVSNASHELRTPVTSIRGFAETIKQMSEDDIELKEEFLDIIYKESLRLEHIVEHMLALSKVKNTQLQKTQFSINDFLHDIGNSMKHQLDQKKQSLVFELTQDFAVETDKYLLSQVLLNLLSNAIRYTDEGGKITLSTVFDEQKLKISVSDTGIGIRQMELERIFERFYRVNKGRSRQSGGTGLGLSIVKELIQLLGGTVTVRSQLGEGSQFTISLSYYLIEEVE
ncbi:alkaline phosphatase synthesis sensor protein [Streptococcus pseudoporcinus]|uniref:histidine kinase n=1 Tax=Streptococcus pseudoporcinus TaxID=361101 RepID=A0A4U9XX69_9STRE|nr:ATP-binding protein [Streptococcus pseudoporcinus]VTS17565.1 alkaline phosphatase synthesis sensor protein [Streptococcus pseudoporcinus]